MGGAWYERWVLPDVLKKYLHDGQVGLAVAGAMITGALVCAVIVLVFGLVLTVKTSKRPQITASESAVGAWPPSIAR